MKEKSPNKLTLDLFRNNGWFAETVEHQVKGGIKRDLLGFIDILCITPGAVLGVQATTKAKRSARRKKILGSERALKWLRAGGGIALVLWREKFIGDGWEYEPEVEPIVESDFLGQSFYEG